MLWRQFTLRHWQQAPKSALLLVCTLALGVAVFLSIRLANRAAVAGFTLFTETLTGESDLVLLPATGSFPDEILSELRGTLGVLPVSLFPVLETTASEPASTGDDGFDAEQYQVVGLDIVGLGNLAYLEPGAGEPAVSIERSAGSSWDIRGGPTQVFVSSTLATERELQTGDSLTVILNEKRVDLELRGVLPERGFRARTPANLLVMDLPALQGLLDLTGRLSRVEVRLPKGSHYLKWLKEADRQLAAASDGRYEVLPPDTERSAGETMTQAFRLNLTILSALALLVGLYLILQALEAAVVRRRPEIGVLRSLGVTQGQIQRAWLVEALTLGLVGSALGLAGGYLGAQWAVGAVSRTVNALYHSTTVTAARLDPIECLLAVALGTLGSLAAGWLPARDAATTPPAQVLRAGVRGGGICPHPWLGWGLALGGIGLTLLPPISLANHVRFPAAGYVAALCWVVGGSILAGSLFLPLTNLLAMPGARSAWVRYAASQLRRPSGRQRLTVAGLVIALAMASGMSILIQSFEHTMTRWIDRSLKADLYVAAQGVGNISSRNRIQPRTLSELSSDPDVAGVDSAQIHPLRWKGVQTALVGLQLAPYSQGRELVWIKRPPAESTGLTSLVAGQFPAWISESFQERFGTRIGDILELPTPTGPRRVRVSAVFADYGNERGSIIVDRMQLATWLRDPTLMNLAAYLRPGVDPDTVRRRWMKEHPGLTVRSNARLREEVMRIFRQTFSVTYVLKGIAVFVAIGGLALALTSLLVERRRELITLKELGVTGRQLALTTGGEGLALALIGVTVGSALSIALGWLLVFVINKQSFGWTLAFRIPWLEMLGLGLVTLLISWTVAWLVGRWGAALPAEQEE